MKRVLVADDNLAARKSIQQVLEMAGIEVVSVGNGELALARIDDVAPQMVLLDAIMPGRSGYEICAEIKAHPSHGRLPVLLVTSDFETYDEERAARARADGHLVKPLDAHAIAILRDVWTKYAPEAAEQMAPATVGLAGFAAPGREADGTDTTGVDPYATTVVPALEAEDDEDAEEDSARASAPGGARGAALPDVAVEGLGGGTGTRARAVSVLAAATTEDLDPDLARDAEESMVRSALAAGIRSVPSGDLCVVRGACFACREPLAAGDVVCIACGTSVLMTLDEAAAFQRSLGPRCPDCAQPVVAADIFCISCGAVL
jgi:CheY-like chemotaxis protein